MQIKRFEAADMTEALRRVKREFGDDAVILSAKEVRPRGFFSALKKKRVEIAAAADYPVEDADDGDAFRGLLAQQLEEDPPTDTVSLSTSLPTGQAVARYAQASAQPTRTVEKDDVAEPKKTGFPNQLFDPNRIDSPMAQSLRRGSPGAPSGVKTATGDRARRSEADRLVAAPFYAKDQQCSRIALVGPPGTGKSSVVAKLAVHCQGGGNTRTGIISLDRFHMGANAMLKSVARILNLPLVIVHDGEQLRTALNELADVDVVLIDTPGMGAKDPDMMADVDALLRIAAPDEIHLVLNATVRRDILSSAVKTFSTLDVSRILFTHMDEYGTGATVEMLLNEMRLPSSFFTNGTDLFDHLKETTIDRLARFCPEGKAAGGQVSVFPGKREPLTGQSFLSIDDGSPVQFVANRNSELFHHPNCRSVKRINAENITAFSSIEQAMGEGFKPCRACCNISMIRKAADGAFGDQRARAI